MKAYVIDMGSWMGGERYSCLVLTAIKPLRRSRAVVVGEFEGASPGEVKGHVEEWARERHVHQLHCRMKDCGEV